MRASPALLSPLLAVPLLAVPLLAAAGCWSVELSPTPAAPQTLVLPGPVGAPPALAVAAGAAEELPGIDTAGLSDRERRAWWKLVSQLYTPCADQAVSVAQCVKEARPCAACAPAATLLANKVHEGATAEEAQAIYATRFGPSVKQVDLTDSPSRGPADAPVTLVVWSDFECPHCRLAQPIWDAALTKFAPRLRLVHKFYRLQSHSRAEPAARAAVAALNQGKYWEMEKLLFQNQHDLTDADLDKYAAQVGLDLGRFHADEGAESTTRMLKRDQEEAERAGLTGTPFILVNGRDFDLAFFKPGTDLEPWIKTELALHDKAGAAPPPLGPAPAPPKP